MPVIPNTKLRLKSYITLKTIKGGASIVDPNNVLASLQALNKPFETIGTVQKFSYENTRDAKYYRELRTDSSAQIVETYPGLPEYNLTLEKVLLISENVLEAFGFENQSFDIINQSSPIILQLILPGAGGSATGSKTLTFHGVWLKTNPFEFDVTEPSDLKIIQTISAIAAGVVES